MTPAARDGAGSADRESGGAGGGPARRVLPVPEAGDRPGDPACLLRRVCPACGAVADEDPPTTCPQCHREIPTP